jgi:hypothetical protein
MCRMYHIAKRVWVGVGDYVQLSCSLKFTALNVPASNVPAVPIFGTVTFH